MSYSAQQLDSIYCHWTGDLHRWVNDYLGAKINAQYFPAPDWKMKIWAGEVDFVFGSSGVFRIDEPPGTITLGLPRPEREPTQADLDGIFRALCISAARALGISPRQFKLPAGAPR
jgi:hypothetical protein